METYRGEVFVYEGFLVSVILKGALSLVEVISGIALLFIPPATIVATATFFLQFIPITSLSYALEAEVAKYTTGTVLFVALYLFSRGIIKVALIWALLTSRLWAYPWSLVVLGLFVLYQLYQIAAYHSLIVLGITLFDLVVMYFIYREWRIVLLHQKTALSS